MRESRLYRADFSSGTPTLTRVIDDAATSVQKTPTGFIANFSGKTYYYTIDATGETATQHGSAIGYATSDPYGDGTVWINDSYGLHVEGSAAYYKINSLII